MANVRQYLLLLLMFLSLGRWVSFVAHPENISYQRMQLPYLQNAEL